MPGNFGEFKHALLVCDDVSDILELIPVHEL